MKANIITPRHSIMLKTKQELKLDSMTFLGKSGSKQRFGGFQEEEEEFVNAETIFEAMFGGSHGFTWSFSSWQNFCNSRCGNSTYSSRFTGESRRKRAKERTYFSETDADESENNFNPFVGSSANRAALGLPRTAPLKLEDVKIAYVF